VVNLDGIAIKLARNPRDGDLYFLNPVEGIFRVQLGPPGTKTKVVDIGTIFSEGMPAGMAFGPDGTLFVVANRRVEEIRTQAIIRRGLPTDNGYRWETLASTEPYPLSNTNFDHLFNGMLVSPDGQWLYINSGSRTDHGEIQSNNGAFPDTREVALTSKIFRLPTSVTDLLLPNDDEQLAAEGWIFAQGTRNAYDLEWAPNGELFAPDNGPDADYPDELNLVRAGQHYGFPWRFGSQANPQQFPDYDPARDPRLHPDFMAVQTGTYQNDPTFPTAPGTFTDPIANRGPAATQYIGDDGSQRDAASEGQTLTTFTPHRSPLGLVFATSSTLPADLQGTELELSAFVLSWGAAGGSLSDKGQDLLHVRLIPTNAGYQAATQLIARGFKNPIDGVMIDNRLYVLEYNQGGQLWELTFE
jgi:glucose/arabinose dehydrogenase